MRYLIILAVFFTFFTATAHAHQPVYVLASSDVSTFYSGFQQALERSPNHQSSSWFNPRTGLSGATVPLKTVRIASGQICREYLATVQLDDATQQSVGTACRQADGSWKIAGEELVRSAGVQLKFVVVRQKQTQQAGCAHGNHSRSDDQLRIQQHDKRFHSPQFHESLQQLQQKAPAHAPREQQRPASKLIQLVGY